METRRGTIAWLLTCVVLLLTVATPSPAGANPEDGRRQVLELITILSGYPPYTGPEGSQRLADLRLRVLALTPGQLAVLNDAAVSARLGDALATLRATASFAASGKTRAGARADRGVQAAQVPMTTVPVIPGFTALDDLPYSGLCPGPEGLISTEVAFGFLIGAEAAATAGVIAQAVCDSLVIILGEGSNVPGCIAAGIANEAAVAARAVFDHADFCDGDVHGVITRGIYEGLGVVHSKIDGTFRREIEDRLLHCETLVSLRLPAALGGQAETVHEIVETFLTKVTQAGDVHPRSLQQARSRIDSAVVKIAEGRYIDAYQDYCMAYRFLAMQAR